MRIVRLAGRGDGVTEDGRYVAMTAPGDLVRPGPGGAELIEAGPARAAPLCRHYPDCGGCQLQHVNDAAWSNWMIERIGWVLRGKGLAAARILPPHLSPPRTRRRATLRAIRTAQGIVLGFHGEASHRVIDLAECHVLAPPLLALVAPLRRLLASLLPPGLGGGVTMALAEGGVDLLLSNLSADTPAQAAALAAFARDHDLARLSVEGPGGISIIAAPRPPQVRLGGVAVRLPPAAFLQATADGEAALVAAVREASAGARRIADLFCGLGTFALPLAAAGARVLAADAAGPAVEALGAAARSAGLPVRTLHRDLFRRPLVPSELAGLDAVVFDPPRAGAKEQAAELARAAVPRVIAVSCNPATFARDAALLVAGGYRVGRVWPVGQFRWSTHIELVAEFMRAECNPPLPPPGHITHPA